MHQDIEKIVFPEKTIRRQVRYAAELISRDYRGRSPVLVGILKGAFIFLADLARHIDVPVQIDFLRAASYGRGAVSSGQVEITKDIEINISGRDVILAEDIVDTGLTMAAVIRHLYSKGPASVRLCALLDKSEARKNGLKADYVCFSVPNGFFVGYGLDYAENYRHLPYIGVLKPEIYS